VQGRAAQRVAQIRAKAKKVSRRGREGVQTIDPVDFTPLVKITAFSIINLDMGSYDPYNAHDIMGYAGKSLRETSRPEMSRAAGCGKPCQMG
jgi:hypothetical protein